VKKRAKEKAEQIEKYNERREMWSAAVVAMVEIGIPDWDARLLCNAIAAGLIPHVTSEF